MRVQPKYRMLINMTTYGATLGGLAGAVSAVTLILTSSTFEFSGSTLPVMLLEIIAIAAFGLILGGIFGTMAGIYSGVSMTLVTSLFFKEDFSYLSFKIAMGLITALSTVLYFYNGLWHLRLKGMDHVSWDITILMAIIMAVYASQRVASYYLYEWSLHKQKVYA